VRPPSVAFLPDGKIVIEAISRWGAGSQELVTAVKAEKHA
jgi:hypothetical protein